jgi:hypothetical protein
MGLREILVRITGSETVSKAAKDSDSALSGLSGKVKALGAAFAALGVTAALGKFFKDAIAEASAAEKGLARLGVAVSNTGNDFDSLKPQLESTVSSVMKLSTATDDDLREALTRMITVSGDVEGSMKNLALVTDLAAFKNVDLETAAISVGKAMNGNTTELNRLGVAGKDSITVLENLRQSVGGFAASEAKTFSGSLQRINNQWGEFKEAVGTAILSGGQMGSLADGLAGTLAKLATWVEQNADKIALFTDAVFSAIGAVADVASAILDVLGPPLKWLAQVGFVAIVGALNILELGLKRTAGTFQEFAGTALEAIGTVIEKGGKLLKLFGIEVVSETGTALKEFGKKLHEEGVAANSQAVTDFRASMGKLGTAIKGGEKEHTDTVRQGAAARTTIRKKEADEALATHLEMEIARQKATKEANELLAKTKELLEKQNLKQYAEQWAEIDRNVRKVKGDLSDTLPSADKLRQSIDENKKAMEANAEAAKKNREHIKDTVAEAATLGRAFIDAGQAAGVLSAEAASALNSVVNMATALAEHGLGSVTGIVGVVSGLANILAGIGDGPAAKVVRENSRAVERLTREIGNLNLSATGRTFEGAESAIQATIAAIKSGKIGGRDTNEIGRNAQDFFKRELARAGVSTEEAEELFKQLGFGDVFANGRSFLQSLPQLQQGLKATEFGQFGQDFESQLKAFQEGVDIFGLGEAEQFAGLSEIAKKFSPGIATALQAADPEEALKQLFSQLVSGGLDPSAFGDLNGEQFLELIKLLLPLVGASGSATPGLPIPPPTVTPHKPIDPIGAIGSVLGNLSALPLTPDFGVPTIPPLGVRPGLTTGGGAAGSQSFVQQVSQLIQGDLINQFNITPRDATDPEEIAEIVAQRLGDRYTLQRGSLGLT